MKQKPLKVYYIKKRIEAADIAEALRIERRYQPIDIWEDSDRQDTYAIGFRVERKEPADEPMA